MAVEAVVNKSIPSGEVCVWGGPAHYIMKTKDYADKCKENTPILLLRYSWLIFLAHKALLYHVIRFINNINLYGDYMK